jgi:hypothetical protein
VVSSGVLRGAEALLFYWPFAARLQQFAEKFEDGRLVGLKAASRRRNKEFVTAHLKVCPFKAGLTEFFRLFSRALIQGML